VIQALREFYGLQPTPPADLFQFFVWEILSEGALPARRDLAWQALRRLPALTPDSMFRVPAKELLDAIGMAGPHRDAKADRLKALAGEFKRHRDVLTSEALRGMTPIAAVRVLQRLEQVPRAVRARSILFAAGHAVLPMDDETLRVIARLMGEGRVHGRVRTRQWLTRKLPRDTSTYRDAIIYLRHHAQYTCTAVAPHCRVCPLAPQCAAASSTTRRAGEAP
jgi:endonuclease III